MYLQLLADAVERDDEIAEQDALTFELQGCLTQQQARHPLIGGLVG